MILKDPAVESLSSFIGVDGTNTTLNSGRILINSSRSRRATDQRQRGHPPPATELADVEGITLFMQPVQDLTVEDRVSRTQYQYSLEDPDPAELQRLGAAVRGQLRSLPELRDVASDQQDHGLQAALTSTATPPRAWASRRR